MTKYIVFILLVLLSLEKIQAQPYFPVKVNNLWGAIDTTGKLVLEPMYDYLKVLGGHNQYIVAFTNDSAILLNSEFQIIVKTDFEDINYAGEGIFVTSPKSEGNGYNFGLMDSTGKILFEPQFISWIIFDHGFALVEIDPDPEKKSSMEEVVMGVVDKKGNWAIPPINKSINISAFKGGLLSYYEEGKGWGAIDTNGIVVIEPKYKGLTSLNNGYLIYSDKNNATSGLMKSDETIIIPDNGTYAVFFNPITEQDTFVFVHTMTVFEGSFIPLYFTDCMIYSSSGKYLFDLPYSHCDMTPENNFFFTYGNKRGIITSAGQIIMQPDSTRIEYYQPGLKQCKTGNKCGFADNEWNIVIPCQFDNTQPFNNGLAAIYYGGTAAQFNYPSDYPNVSMGYINEKGKVVWNPSK